MMYSSPHSLRYLPKKVFMTDTVYASNLIILIQLFMNAMRGYSEQRIIIVRIDCIVSRCNKEVFSWRFFRASLARDNLRLCEYTTQLTAVISPFNLLFQSKISSSPSSSKVLSEIVLHMASTCWVH